MKSILLAVLMFAVSTFALAGENEIFFETKSECQIAKAAKHYVPALKRPAPKEWKREALTADTCVQMDTVQGKFFVKLQKGTELAQNPKTGAWHHVMCTNWTDWKQPEQKVVEVEVPKVCDDCNKVVEHTTTVIKKLVVRCEDGTTITLDGSDKKDPEVKCPDVKTKTDVSSETKVQAKTSANCQGENCVNRPTEAEKNNLCRAKDGKAECRFKVTYESLRPPKAGECGLQNKEKGTLALIHGSKDYAECCVRKDALISVLKKL
jgi:hypothetical protein